MTTPSTAAGAPAAPMGLLSRFVGVITSPKATFQAVVAHPRWFGMLVIVTVIVAAGVTPADDDRSRPARRRSITTSGRSKASGRRSTTRDVRGDAANGMRFVGLLQTFVSVLIIRPGHLGRHRGHPLRRLHHPLGGQATFKQLFAVYVHSAVDRGRSASSSPVPLNYFRGSMTSATNLAVLSADDRRPVVPRPAARHDRPVLDLAVRACSPSALACSTGSRTQPIAIRPLRRLRVIIVVLMPPS